MPVRRRALLLRGGGGLFREDDMHELAYAENSSGPLSVTSTNWASPNTLVTAASVTFDGSTAVIIEAGATSIIPPSSDEWINAGLYEDGTLIGVMGGAQNDASVGTGKVHTPWYVSRRMTPSAGAHVYSIGFVVATGTGQVNFGAGGPGTSPVHDMPAYIRIVTAGN